MARKRDIKQLAKDVGTFDAPIGRVQVPESGVRYDRHGQPKALPSGQDEHPERASSRAAKRSSKPEPELAFATDLFIDDPEERSALAACHKVLSRGLTTEKRLRDKLIQGGHETDAIEAAISRCRDAGLINDERYACDYVESRVRRGHGPQRIRHDLLQRGIDRAHIDTALADITPDGLEDAALTAARRKFARVDLEAAPARAKAMRWLVGRGYSMSDASATITAVRLEQAAAADDTA